MKQQRWIPVAEQMPPVETEVRLLPQDEDTQTAPPEPHWKDRMMNTFLGGR